MTQQRILLVEDDTNFGNLLRDTLEFNEYQVDLERDGVQGLRAYKQGEYDLCIFDIMMPKKDGITLATEVKAIDNGQPLIFLTAKGQKEDIIDSIFFQNFKGEIVKYDENQIIENKDNFLETCLNESLFEDKKILVINIFTEKLYSLIKELSEKNINNKKIIFNSGALDKKSKIRKLFEAEENLACIAFYKDNNMTLFKIANDFFKKNNISISGENINLVIEKCMGDRKNLYNEMNKILNFCFKKKK